MSKPKVDLMPVILQASRESRDAGLGFEALLKHEARTIRTDATLAHLQLLRAQNALLGVIATVLVELRDEELDDS